MGKYLAFNHDGSSINEWTIPTLGTSFFNMPCLADLNNNGILDLMPDSLQVEAMRQTFTFGIPELILMHRE